MEALTRLVSDSLARHGLDRPVDPRRLQWSRWFPCDSPHSLLVVPSKPGIFALAESIMAMVGNKEQVGTAGKSRVGTGDSSVQSEPSSAWGESAWSAPEPLGGAALQRFDSSQHVKGASAAELLSKRMLAVLQFSEDDNMAYVLDRMFTHINPMRARLHAGNCFVRFVVVEDQQQRRSICAALNQWMRNSAEKATGLQDFSSSLETNVVATPRVLTTASVAAGDSPANAVTTNLDSGARKNLHCPQPLPSGF